MQKRPIPAVNEHSELWVSKELWGWLKQIVKVNLTPGDRMD